MLKTSAAVAVAGVVAGYAIALWELVAISAKASVSINRVVARSFLNLVSKIIDLQVKRSCLT